MTPKTLLAVGLWGATTTVFAYLLSFGNLAVFVVLLLIIGVAVRVLAYRIVKRRGEKPPPWWWL